MVTVRLVTGDVMDVTEGSVVIPINTVGAMGKGLAKQYRDRFPMAYRRYKQLCKDGLWPFSRITLMHVNRDLSYVLMPTKGDWRESSNFQDVLNNLKRLREHKTYLDRQPLHLVPVGCGEGQLNPEEMLAAVREIFAEDDMEVWYYY